jgi:Holliday junction resolvasome RuvABC ATP-dependent DNA helicase subunit
VEFAGFFNTHAKELRKTLKDLNLKSAGSHVGIETLNANLGELIEYSLEIGNPYLICPWLPKEMRNSADAYKRTGTCQTFNFCCNFSIQTHTV